MELDGKTILEWILGKWWKVVGWIHRCSG